jgi:hypothetical protein
MPRNLVFSIFNKGFRTVISALGIYLVLSSPATAQECPSAQLCRETAPGGSLLHNPNSNGNRVWTTACGPNSSRQRVDQICQQISSCPAAGGFGKFLQAVTGDCRSKQFNGYFGLDGMTFGILDWTADNLPPILQAYQLRDNGKFDELFKELNLPIKDGCLDPKWACDNNKRGKLMCDAGFHDAFQLSLNTAEYQKAQVEYALKQYEKRLARFSNLGLKTEYGNTAMAVVANNLLRNEDCRPETWKNVCAAQPDETQVVQCMLRQYANNGCRGSLRGSKERMIAINKVFAGAQPSGNIHPTADAIISCSDNWGRGG